MDLLKTIEGRHYLLTIFTEYLSKNHIEEIRESIKEFCSKLNTNSFVLRIDAMILLQEYSWILSYLLNNSLRLIKLLNSSFTKLIYSMIPPELHKIKEVPKCFIRIRSLPLCDEIFRTAIPKSVDVGKFLSVAATVVRAGAVQVLEYQREYTCKRCKQPVISEFSESDSSYVINPPKVCFNSSSGCISSSFELSEDSKSLNSPRFCKNRQEINIQEQIKYLSFGCMPRTIKVLLDDDLVDMVKPGDDVLINGTIIRRWNKPRLNEECEIQIVILANEIQIVNNSPSDSFIINNEARQEFQTFWDKYPGKPFSGRNAIISHICPLIYGMYFLKLALALVLTGSENCSFDGIKVRGELHMLLVGDPGTAKSQFLKFAHKFTPRSVLTTGMGSTNAGLTVTVVKESGDWSLEAGALVLADGGICCIDEFTSIRECDKVAIHEAMEQQTISVAKAGIICKLRTRCSIIAATNSKGNYDITQSITANTAIASPLLSRFDLIFLLLDNCNESWDKCVSDFILKHQTFEHPKNTFSIDQLKVYLSFIRSNFHPKMSAQASIILEKYYTWMRRSETTNSLDRITMRFLESLIRLSLGHARLMMRNLVQEEDAVVAVAIMESTVYGSTVLSTDMQLPSSFPIDPEKEYLILKENIFKKLQIDIDIPMKKNSDEGINNSSMTSKPLIVPKNLNKKPFEPALKKKINLNKTLNKSILDNFHISTQVDEDHLSHHNSFIDNVLNEDVNNSLINPMMDDLENDLSNFSTIEDNNNNIFAHSIIGHQELTDDDFQL